MQANNYHVKQKKNREGTEALGRLYGVSLDKVGREMETLCIVNIPICRVVADGFKKLFHPVCSHQKT